MINAKQSATGALELYFYTDIAGDSYDWWTGKTKVSETSCDFVRKALANAGNVPEIILYINSFGGSVKEALGIYSQLRRHPATVTGYCDGYAASAASVILAAADKVIMGCNTVQMLHYPLVYAYGNADELRKLAEALDVLGTASEEAYLEKAGDKLTREKLHELMTNETYIDAKTCLELGLCDEISNKVVDMAEAKTAALKDAQDNMQAQKLAAAYEKQYGELGTGDPASKAGGEPTPQPVPDTIANFETAFYAALEKIYNQ